MMGSWIFCIFTIPLSLLLVILIVRGVAWVVLNGQLDDCITLSMTMNGDDRFQ
ncbi:MAG: cbb3-type cytochrome oxidase assembly protein CcoS [Gammaproteobacteria bacterium]|nr:cbb3-type cytochrome oxidase assembly protein CcoS [Gammaproteobacteria bacterium]